MCSVFTLYYWPFYTTIVVYIVLLYYQRSIYLHTYIHTYIYGISYMVYTYILYTSRFNSSAAAERDVYHVLTQIREESVTFTHKN